MTAGRRRHTPEVPFRTDVQKAHTDTHSISHSLQHVYTAAQTYVTPQTETRTQTLGTDSIKDQNEARRDLAERHGMFQSWIFDCAALNQFSHRCPPEGEGGQEVGSQSCCPACKSFPVM